VLSARTPHTEIAGDLQDRTFHLGVHHRTGAIQLTGTVTLDAENNSDAIFIFQTNAAFNTAADSTVNLIRGAKAANVYWVVGDTAGTGANTSLSGTILATAITLGAGTVLDGRALSRTAVTLDSNSIALPVAAQAGRSAMAPMVAGDLSASAQVTTSDQAGTALTATTEQRATATSTGTAPETAFATAPGTATPQTPPRTSTTAQTPPASSTPGRPAQETVPLVESTELDAAAEPASSTSTTVSTEVTAP